MRPPRPAAAHALLAIAGALAACARPAGESCPGELFAELRIEGVLDRAGTGCVAPPEGGWEVPDPLPAFDAELRWDEDAETFAFCPAGPHAAVLRGTREGNHVRAEASLPGGAVLGPCAASCLPTTTVAIEGDLAGGDGAPLTFAGPLTATFDGGTGPCGVCQLPCTSQYLVTGSAP